MLLFDELLKEVGADNLDILWPVTNRSLTWPPIIKNLSTDTDCPQINPLTIQDMYGKNNLADVTMFAGGYINFGLWKDIDYKNKKLSLEDRLKSSQNLYNLIFEKAIFDEDSEIIEVGSGQGFGCVMILNNFKVKRVVGLDATKEQTDRSRSKHSAILENVSILNFVTGYAEKIPFAKESFTHLISVEAAHHFKSIPQFLSESYRVLKPTGVLTLTTFLPKNEKSVEKLRVLIPDFDVHITSSTISDVKKFLIHDFREIEIESIGEYVWDGLDEWLNQGKYRKAWSRIWQKAYESGLVDYYVIQAKSKKL